MKAALADDFDTPRAVDAIMDLIHHANRQLKASSKVTPRTGPESTVFVWFFLMRNRHDAPNSLQLVLPYYLLSSWSCFTLSEPCPV